jgi:hypothetical protein
VSYWEYYNFFLNNLLERRVQNKNYFTEEEFWHLVMVCCGGYKSLKSNQVFYDFSPDRIAVTPEGRLKLYWAHASVINIHMNYVSFCESRFQDLPVGYYSPE